MTEELTQEMVATKLWEIIQRLGLDAQIVHDPDEDAPFLILSSWDDDKIINAEMEPFMEPYDEDPKGHGNEGWDNFVEFGFSDSYAACAECGNLVETSPTHYGWQPMYAEFEFGGYTCAECVRQDFAEEYIVQHVNAHRRLLNAYVIDPAEHGWVDLELRMETGYHHGQNDNPQAVVEALAPQGVDCLFTGSVGQFDVNWTVWVREDKVDEARQILHDANTRFPYDLATELGNALSGKVP